MTKTFNFVILLLEEIIMNAIYTKELLLFNERCREFVEGKYIVVDIKLKGIIDAIADSELLTSLVSRSLNNFNFNEVFKETVGNNLHNGKVLLPELNKDIVALVYNILASINAKKITFYDFISKYMKTSNTIGSNDFKAFADFIVRPFQDSINHMLEIEFAQADIVAEDKSLTKLTQMATKIIDEIEDMRLGRIDSEDLRFLLNTLIKSANENNEQYKYAILLAIDYFCQTHRKQRDIIIRLRNSIDE